MSRIRSRSVLGSCRKDARQLYAENISQGPWSSLSNSCSTARRRSTTSSAFFSTAPSPNFLKGENYFNDNVNSPENDAFVTDKVRGSTTSVGTNRTYEESTIDRIVSGGIGEYQSVDVDSVVTEDYLERLVDDHISHSNVPPNPNMLLNMLELLHNEETHISSETVLKIFREVVRSKRVKLLERAEDVVVKNRYDPRLLRLLVTGYVNAGAPIRACKLLIEWPSGSMQHQPGIESYRRVLTALGSLSNYYNHHNNNSEKQRGKSSRKYNGAHRSRRERSSRNNEYCRQDQEVQPITQKNHRHAQQLLQHMCQIHFKFPELSLAPDRDCFHRVIGTCSSVESLSTAKEILCEMKRFNDKKAEELEEHNCHTPASFDTGPNLSTIHLLVKSWTTSVEEQKKTIEMQKEGFEFLRAIELEELSRRQQGSHPPLSNSSPTIVDVNCYNIILNRLAELGQYEVTENMFRRLLTDYVKGEKSNIQPDTVTLNTVLKSHVKANTEEAAKSAERFLGQLDDFYEKQERIRKKKRFVIDDDYDDTPRVVYDIQPTARARAIVSNLLVKLGQPDRAIEILKKAESVYREKEQHLLQLQQQHVDSAHSYSTDIIKQFRPDKISYRQIIGGLCKLPPTAALATKAEEIADRMCKMGHPLNLLTCNTILNCWTKSGNPDLAEIFLEEKMREHNVVPDVVSYNTIIHGHAQLGNLDRALELLTRLLEDNVSNFEATNKSKQRRSLYPKPNVRTFTNIIVALSKEKTVKAAEEAEGLLLRMQELNEPPFNWDTRPNIVTCNALMNCWASLSLPSLQRRRKREIQKTNDEAGSKMMNFKNDNDHHRFGRKAEFVLRSMQGLGANERPNAISFNTVIRAYSNDMKKAEELVQDMIANGIKPTDHTYKTLVHVLNRDFSIKDKDKKLEEIRNLYFAENDDRLLNNGRSPFRTGRQQEKRRKQYQD